MLLGDINENINLNVMQLFWTTPTCVHIDLLTDINNLPLFS